MADGDTREEALDNLLEAVRDLLADLEYGLAAWEAIRER